MEEYREYLEERLNGMYDAYNSPLLEGFKKNKNVSKEEMMRQDFYRYLKQQYPDFNKKEFTQVKTKEEADKVVNKYKDDFYKFCKKQNKRIIPTAIHLGIIAADFVGLIPRNVSDKLYKILLVDDIIYYGKELKKGFK